MKSDEWVARLRAAFGAEKSFSTQEVVVRFGLNERKVNRLLLELIQAGVMERIGVIRSRKTRYRLL